MDQSGKKRPSARSFFVLFFLSITSFFFTGYIIRCVHKLLEKSNVTVFVEKLVKESESVHSVSVSIKHNASCSQVQHIGGSVVAPGLAETIVGASLARRNCHHL